jgi:hypothetical protein
MTTSLWSTRATSTRVTTACQPDGQPGSARKRANVVAIPLGREITMATGYLGRRIQALRANPEPLGAPETQSPAAGVNALTRRESSAEIQGVVSRILETQQRTAAERAESWTTPEPETPEVQGNDRLAQPSGESHGKPSFLRVVRASLWERPVSVLRSLVG